MSDDNHKDNDEDCVVNDVVNNVVNDAVNYKLDDGVDQEFIDTMQVCFHNAKNVLDAVVNLSDGNGMTVGYTLMYALAMAHVSVVGNDATHNDLLAETFKDILKEMQERVAQGLLIEKKVAEKDGCVQ